MDTYFSQAQARSLKPNTALQKTKIWRQRGKEAFSNARLKSKKRRAGARKTSTVKAVCEGTKNFFIFSKKGLTNRVRYAIIHRLSGNPTQKASSLYRSGCGADGSALPWGGRGRWFKSSHSDQKNTDTFWCRYFFRLRCTMQNHEFFQKSSAPFEKISRHLP